MLRLLRCVHSPRVKPPPGPPHHAAEFVCLGKASPVSPAANTHTIPSIPGDGSHPACDSCTSRISKGFATGMASSGSWCLRCVSQRCELCLFNLRVHRYWAVLFQRSRCAVHCQAVPGACPCASRRHSSGTPPHRVGAGCTPEPGVPRGSLSPGRAPAPRAVLGGQHRLLWPCRGSCPRVSPLGCAADALPPALAALLPWRLRALLLGS